MPRMITEARQHERMRPGERAHLRSVGLARAVHDHARNAGAFAFGEQFHLPAAKTVVLQMIVRVVEIHREDGGWKIADSKSTCRVSFCKLFNFLPDARKGVATVGREVLSDAERREKAGVVRENFGRRVAAVKVAEQAGDGFDDK